MKDADRITAYGRAEPGFGGVYADGDLLVALFTGELPRHEKALRRIVDRPDRLAVRATDRSLAEVQRARTRIRDRLMGPDGVGAVNSVGIGVDGGRFVVEVGISPYDDERVAAVRAAAHPDGVVVRERPHPRLLDDGA